MDREHHGKLVSHLVEARSAAAPRSRIRSSSATSVSIIVFPTNFTRDSSTPSARRLSTASSQWRKQSSDRWSAAILFVSSGIVRSKLRSPDSTCATAMPSSAAQSAAPSVEFTSPGTTTRSGRSARRTGSRRSSTLAICSEWLAEPTPRT